jgi:apolipoprotein N-acyltransferase
MSERQRAATPGNLGRPGRWASVLLLAAAVLLTVAAYPPRGWWLLGLVMLAPLVALLEPARPLRGFALVYAYYVGMGIVIVRWLVHAMAGEYGVPVVAAWSVTLLVVLCYSMPGAIAGGVYCALRTRVGIAAAPVLFGATWGLGEWLRAGPLGLPWLLSGQVVTPAPLALQTADLGGVYAVGFGVVCLNAGVGLAVSARKAAPLALPVIIALLGLGYGAWRLHGLAPRGKPVRVGVVQASVPQSDRFQPGSAERNTLQHMALTRTLASRERVDLVVWSETAVDDDLDALPRLRRSLETLAREIDANSSWFPSPRTTHLSPTGFAPYSGR